MTKFEEYRSKLAEQINQESEKKERRGLIQREKDNPLYWEAREEVKRDSRIRVSAALQNLQYIDFGDEATHYLRHLTPEEFEQSIRTPLYKVREIIKRDFKNYSDCRKCSGKGEEVFEIVSILSGHLPNTEHIEEQMRNSLRGKRILILGDDIGSLSNILNDYGAEACGIEYDKEKVADAHRGAFAKDGKPQTQVIQGSIWELADSDSKPFQSVTKRGPFDLIYSKAVINIGSGFYESNPKKDPERRWSRNDPGEWDPIKRKAKEQEFELSLHLDKLMSVKGISFHSHTDVPLGDIAQEAFVALSRARKNVDKKIFDKDIKPILLNLFHSQHFGYWPGSKPLSGKRNYGPEAKTQAWINGINLYALNKVVEYRNLLGGVEGGKELVEFCENHLKKS